MLTVPNDAAFCYNLRMRCSRLLSVLEFDTETGTSRCIQVYLVNSEIYIALDSKVRGCRQELHGAFRCTL